MTDARPPKPPERLTAGPDCVTCGACCFGHEVRVDPDDEGRLSADEVLSLTRLDDKGVLRIMRTGTHGGCIALRIEGDRFLCGIYDRRPHVCEEYERGGRRCIEWRDRGLPDPAKAARGETAMPPLPP